MKYLFFLLFSLSEMFLFAQKRNTNNLIISINSGSFKPTHLDESLTGIKPLNSLGYELNVAYLFKPTAKFGMDFGLGVGTYSFSTKFNLQQKDYNYLTNDLFPFSLKFRDKYYSLYAGINYGYSLNSKYRIVSLLRCKALRFDEPNEQYSTGYRNADILNGDKLAGFVLTKPKQIVINTTFGLGLEKTFKNNNSLAVNALLGRNINKPVEAIYFIKTDNQTTKYRKLIDYMTNPKLELLYTLEGKKETEKGYKKHKKDFFQKKNDISISYSLLNSKTIWKLSGDTDSLFSNDVFNRKSGFNVGLDFALSDRLSLGISYGKLHQYRNISIKSYPIEEWYSGSESELKRYSLLGKYFYPLTRRISFSGILGTTISDTELRHKSGKSIVRIDYIPNHKYLITETLPQKNIIPSLNLGAGIELDLLKGVKIVSNLIFDKSMRNTLYQDITFKSNYNDKLYFAKATTNSAFNFNLGIKVNTGFLYNKRDNPENLKEKNKGRKPKILRKE